ncbi:MAG: 6-carboxytetrahydropterin synthase [Bdellovibrionota bacterium]
MLILKRRESFCASHRLFNPSWSDEKNFQVYGKCAHVHGHGHNYKLEVGVAGEISSETGMVFNLQTLKDIISTQILCDVDHKHLNFDVPWLAGKIPTTEVLVEAIWQRLENYFTALNTQAKLYSVTVWETEKNVVTKSV